MFEIIDTQRPPRPSRLQVPPEDYVVMEWGPGGLQVLLEHHGGCAGGTGPVPELAGSALLRERPSSRLQARPLRALPGHGPPKAPLVDVVIRGPCSVCLDRTAMACSTSM